MRYRDIEMAKRGTRDRDTRLLESAKLHVLSLRTLAYYCSSIFLSSGHDENGTDIFRSYSRPNLFREV